MRTRLSGVLVALAIALVMPTAALAADQSGPMIFHGTWTNAEWTKAVPVPTDPPACGFADLGLITAAGNWNVTILPGNKNAAVHITMFVPDFPVPIPGGHFASWGGNSFGEPWLVNSVGSNAFSLTRTNTAWGSTDTFVLEEGVLTFTITPWLDCASATATGSSR